MPRLSVTAGYRACRKSEWTTSAAASENRLPCPDRTGIAGQAALKLSSTQNVPASLAETWRALNDPVFLKDCIPGCEQIDATGENQYKVIMAAKVGPVSARFTGRMTLADLEPPHSYAIIFEGQGGAAGFAKGRANVSLTAQGDAVTALSYSVDAQVGGKLAQVGSRLIDGAARKVAEDFFTAFVEKIGHPDPHATQAAEPQPALAVAAASRSFVARWKVAAITGLMIAGAASWWVAFRT
jgi:carbon monoxide dehydrogenase subunit G